MKSWFVTRLGDPDVALEIRDTPVPKPKKEELLIKVEAFSLNFFDILQCQGNYQEKPDLPFTPGAEIAGVVEKSGEGTSFEKGQRVMSATSLPNGGYTEYVLVNEKDVFPIPDELPYDEASAMFITYHTSYYALKSRANLKVGETVLVHAGSGGVGSAAIQIAKAMGATVIATAGSDEKINVSKKLGADYVINYRKEDFVQIVKDITNNKGADVIFDPVGGEVFHRSRKCIAFDGRILLIGFAGGTIPDVPTNHILIKNYSIVGVHFGYFKKMFPEKVRRAHEELMELYQKRLIKPLIYHRYSFDQVVEALNQLANRKTYGKLVVTT
ncbi:NADPH:quinone oxidoreductase family protein [Bacillus alveayuensis]|jgi:NADPH2:quinone reductase|uniref:NADPH:quinone oxidoreductase family protein n=1 Tax=Aeribacillus alveayuensis TaxID=279215 RepID=UPI0005D0F50F|nr:NADPH:quinone oxidoreductase family protein [Bacillus alveayuensis]